MGEKNMEGESGGAEGAGHTPSFHGDSHLERTVGFKSAVAIAVAAMTGSCLVLPGGASNYSGSSAFLAILISGVLATPHCVCVSELASAMPMNGGEFVYLSQAYGPLIGTMCGIGLYSSLLLKGSFGLVGTIYYLEAVTGKLDWWLKSVIKIGILFVITTLNLQGMKKLKTVQKQFTLAATALIFILALYAFKDFDNSSMKSDVLFKDGFKGVLEGAAFVYMSFAGITKMCSVGGEVKKPGKTLPKGIMTATFMMTLFFSITTLAIVGCTDLKKLKDDFAPFYTMGRIAGGDGLGWATSILCMITMVGMANVAIAAVSRFPSAMARDGLLPDVLTQTFDNGSPYWCILMSAFFMGVCVLTIDVKGIAKLASSFNLIVFISGDLSLLIYRTHSHGKYNPEFLSPYYPFLPLAGVVGQVVLLVVLGPEGIMALLLFAVLGLAIYLVHGRHNARFLGVLIPEQYFGILPDHFKSRVELDKEIERIKNDPLYHYHHTITQNELYERYKTTRPSLVYDKKFCMEKTSEYDLRSGATSPSGESHAVRGLLKEMQKDMYVFRILFTGGGAGGKHTLLDLVGKNIIEDGFDVYNCPKIFEFYNNHGVVLDKTLNRKEQILFQSELLLSQLRHEKSFIRFAGLTGRPSIVLLNRGAMDIKAHCEDKDGCFWQEVLDMCGIDERYLLDRYDMVLHCQTSCVSPTYHGKLNVAEEVAWDKTYIDCWSHHDNYVMLNYSEDFEHKVDFAKKCVLGVIAEYDSNLLSQLSLQSIDTTDIAKEKKRTSILFMNAQALIDATEFAADDSDSEEEYDDDLNQKVKIHDEFSEPQKAVPV